MFQILWPISFSSVLHVGFQFIWHKLQLGWMTAQSAVQAEAAVWVVAVA